MLDGESVPVVTLAGEDAWLVDSRVVDPRLAALL